ncbi:hypothetical protein G8C93_08875 [Cellulosimicrobium cellulans]|uniref:hypothetical protein n=1 Tax=Cellulosimicrobium cellulans TaxID=1710 RepID=UPI001883993D|nr:hypothetical protein [Cellulosimicrobium cellulans]MBE9926004.1 hypothetical protein [Cellulosimicrobium cellulans]
MQRASGRAARAAGLAVALVLVLVGWLVVPVLWVEVDEAGTPPVPPFPTEVQVVDAGTGCGSGGCWRELTLSWPGHDRDALRARVGLGTGQRCDAMSFLDRRVRCVGEADDEAPGATLRVDVGWSRPLGL